MKAKYTLEEIGSGLKNKSWFAYFGLTLFTSTRLTWFLANFTKVTPNQVTLIGLVSAIASGFCFWQGYFIIGAVFFWISYMFDCVDGNLARITKQGSKLGAFLDTFTDNLKIFIYSLGLIVGYLLHVNNGTIDVFLLINILVYVFISDFGTIIWLAVEQAIGSNQGEASKIISGKNKNFFAKILFSYISFCNKKKFRPIWSNVETNGLLFFVVPIFLMNNFSLYLLISNILLFVYFLSELYVSFKVILEINKKK